MTIDDAELVQRIAKLDEDAVEELRSRYEEVLKAEVERAAMKCRDPLKTDEWETMVSDIGGIVIDNAKDYRPAQGTVVEWLKACARLGAVFSLRRIKKWPLTEDTTSWLASGFRIHFRDYPNEHLARLVLQCPLKERKKKKLFFIQAEAIERAGCVNRCVLLHTDRERESWSEAARILGVPAGGVHYYLEQCRERAARLFLESTE